MMSLNKQEPLGGIVRTILKERIRWTLELTLFSVIDTFYPNIQLREQQQTTSRDRD